ncbi:MAG TPA: DUF2231 domain-containing protein [Candidatus Tectomicrobia bacterium]|nr:DUF2231 domain-containing protein [Candidatus Tectomicrobia bacterium]
MTTAARIAKHPIHPMLVPIPIGLWVFSLVSDVIYAVGWGSLIWNDIAFYSMVGGIVGAALAAVPGFIDYRTITDSTVKKVAMTHMLMNLAIVGLFAINVWLRAQRPVATGVPTILSAIGVILLGIAGWLGGELVYRYAMGVEVQPVWARQKPDRYSV